MNEDFGGKPWSYFHYLAIKSAFIVNKPERIYFWYQYEPSGFWWEETKQYLTLRNIEAPNSIYDRPLLHPAHKADVLRLKVLQEYGGVYCDCDVWCLRPFSELKHVGFWMGKQGDNYGLCNATMGSDKNSEFSYIWLEEYKKFRSKGRDKYWDEHSVKIPYYLSKKYKNKITTFEKFNFFEPDWKNIKIIFEKSKNLLSNSYSVHLWETFSWPWLSKLNPDNFNNNCEISKLLILNGTL